MRSRFRVEHDWTRPRKDGEIRLLVTLAGVPVFRHTEKNDWRMPGAIEQAEAHAMEAFAYKLEEMLNREH